MFCFGGCVCQWGACHFNDFQGAECLGGGGGIQHREGVTDLAG